MHAPRDSLPIGTMIDCYTIVKLIGSGGFSLIYLAEDEDTQERVVIKEYLPRKMARRRGATRVEVTDPEQQDAFHLGRKLFYQEVKLLATLHHPNIVRVRTFFLANNTAYLVMDYEPGKNLGTYIKERKKGLGASFLLTVFPPILDALRLIHSNSQLHLDIKPTNIHLRPGGSPLLLDFGAAHHFHRARDPRARQVVTPGFSPLEQYHSYGHIGPWSDIYAIGASMRTCIDGKAPPSAIERDAEDKLIAANISFKGRYPAELLKAIDWAMHIDYRQRPQDAKALLDMLEPLRALRVTAPSLPKQTQPSTGHA